VDAYVLRLVREHTFSCDDFFENRQGACRIMPPLAHRLSETASQWAKLLHPIAHRVARRFERAGALGVVNVSQSRRALPAEAPKAQLPQLLRARKTKEPERVAEPTVSDRRCRRCGARLEAGAKKRRVYCTACITMLPTIASEYALRALRRRQREESGAGPSAEVRKLMGDTRSKRAAAIRAWEAAHPTIPAPHVFASTILPTLAKVRAQDARDATGLSISYCRRLLRGQYIPHPMHWDTLKRLAAKR
jgi:hypothetical protein